MLILPKPSSKPENPYFASGPCAKHKTWQLSALDSALISRSHRSKAGIEKIQEVLSLTRQVLDIPPSYKVGLISGSATAAMECLLWNFLGNRPVDVFVWDFFGKRWADDIIQELKLKDIQIFEAKTCLDQAQEDHDIVFTWNATTTGMCAPFTSLHSTKNRGLVLCDATSAAFGVPLPWEKLDATAFSWQKGLGGEAGQSIVVLSPRAIEHLKSFRPSWPIPHLFKLAHNLQVRENFFQGHTLSTVSLLMLEEVKHALKWVQSVGSGQGLYARTLKNFQILEEWVTSTPWIEFMESRPEWRSPTSVCLKFTPEVSWNWIEDYCALLEQEQVGYDLRNHKMSVPSLRIWTGPTIEPENLQRLLPWLEWAYRSLKTSR